MHTGTDQAVLTVACLDTAAMQAGRIAAEARARLLVLTHFSQRYDRDDSQRLAGQAETAFSGPVVLAHDLDRIPCLPGTPQRS